MLSINYIITLILAHFVLQETITPARIIGIAVIMVGVFLIGGGDE
jgi:undecaprenyl phosphate-alpha-L-ara4N flippase subunit ArnE